MWQSLKNAIKKSNIAAHELWNFEGLTYSMPTLIVGDQQTGPTNMGQFSQWESLDVTTLPQRQVRP